jgi:polysaccharide export outer membrane protein
MSRWQRLGGAGALLLGLVVGVASAQPVAPARTTPPTAAPAAPAVAAAAAPEYRLGAGDIVRITVYQNPDLTVETRIAESGIVSYPLLGQVVLGGRTVGAAERAIADGLRNGNFVRQPQVTVMLLQVRAHQASVLGQVNRPGRYALEQTDLRLSDLLAMAGGVALGGADTVVLTGTRNGQPLRVELDLPALFAGSGRDKDLPVENGDVVWVDRQPLVYIYGEVQRPGAMRLERDMTLMQVLAAGGGLTVRGTEKGIRVHRRGSDGKVQVMQPGLDDRVKDGDVVYVRESLF